MLEGQHLRDYATYPSPSYSDYRGSEGPYRADALSSAPGPPHIREPSLAAQDLPTKERGCDRYAIQVRQQPLAARACGFGERDRRVIDPPPIVQLFIRDPKPVKEGESELRYPFNIVHCTLWNESGSLDETALTSQDRRVTRRLMGTLVSSPFFGLDENDEEGCFFCFPDLSCRTHGKYRLRFVLMRIDVNDISSGKMSPILTEAVSDVFTVFTAKDFPGMRASTSLTKALKRQGCAISVKKGNEKASAHPRDEDSGDEDADETGARTKKRRRG
ncbi:MAG: hypothetical protein M1837_006176 [Sclerophora amabilis]|nr:MAG: hypothetical protein M1837_006176 [Sclerophora amabilis]